MSAHLREGTVEHHPYGVAQTPDGRQQVVVRDGERVVSLAGGPFAELDAPSLDALMAAGADRWAAVREWVLASVSSLPAVESAALLLPFTVADYVDFYASRTHAEAVSALFRPGQPPLQPNWLHLPVGYHGRSGTVVVSGTDVRRPSGQLGPGRFGPTVELDVEAEVAFVIGAASEGHVETQDFARHCFGVVLLNDWSARDVQRFEYVPLGPFLGKSFATSVSAWVTPLDALDAAWVPQPSSEVLPYLQVDRPSGLDLLLELEVDGEVLSRPPFATQWWTGPQLLAHTTVNGAHARTGDLLGSGTVSGPDDPGSLLELHSGTRFLADESVVTLRATAPAVGGGRLALGGVVGRVLPAR